MCEAKPTKRFRVFYGDRGDYGQPEMSYVVRAWDAEHAEFKFWETNWGEFDLLEIVRVRQ